MNNTESRHETGAGGRPLVHPDHPESTAGEGGADRPGGITREMLKTPFMKDILKQYLSHIDADGAPAKAKTLLWEDPEVALSILAALPQAINRAAAMLSTAVEEVQEKYTPQLMAEFIISLGAEIDGARVKESLKGLGRLISTLMEHSPEFKAGLLDAAKGPAADAVGEGINRSIRHINTLHQNNPALFDEIITRVVSKVDHEEFDKASTTIVNAVLDRVSILKLGKRLITSRIRYKISRRHRA